MTFIPLNLYRLQLHAGFTFHDAISILPYLKDLGIDTVYCSPFFQAVKGSTHGYDVANPLQFNQELGGAEGFHAFEQKVHTLGMYIVLDLVANHMAASVENPWWYDVLEQGASSIYAPYFDIRWDSPIRPLTGKVLVPILDLPSQEALLSGKITLILNKSGLFIHAMGQNFPLNPKTYSKISSELKTKRELMHVIHDAQGYAALHQKVVEYNLDVSSMQDLLAHQHFLLEFWQYAPQNINYRRFFDIHGLAALNMNYPPCFQQFHQLVIELFREGKIQGLRIDHPDGLYEPYQYFTALRQSCQGAQKPYLILEKILEREEELPKQWPVEGSVGYEYLNLLNQLFVNCSEEQSWTRLYEAFIEKKVDGALMSREEKRRYALLYMTSELHAMVLQIFDPTQVGMPTETELLEAIVELYASFPVYRTYLDEKTMCLNAKDKEVFFEAFDLARLTQPHLETSFQFLKTIFFHEKKLSESERLFVMRFQQIAPVIMAKGFEDTHLYNYNRFISLNEVGASPHHFGESIEYFHEKIAAKYAHHPYGWMTVSTHDTKRSQDMRMRLNVLSELFEEWSKQVLVWKQENMPYKQGYFPDCNREYFLYQTLVGWWPNRVVSVEEKKGLIERVKNYLIKASRESKAYTNWMHHHTAYEHALLRFIEAILEENTPFYTSLRDWVNKIDLAGQLNSLSCLNLLLTLPASLDIYQGTELWDFSFVDPDNRRPVDYAKRKMLLQKLFKKGPQAALELWKQENLETLKLYMLHAGLHLRHQFSEMWIEGEYIPLICVGQKKEHVIAYLRKGADGKRILVLSGRFLLNYQGSAFWKETVLRLPSGWQAATFTEIYTQEQVTIQSDIDLQKLLPVMPFGLFVESFKKIESIG